MITAIETRYNGYKFRSRLEARWAVALDELGIKYEYEHQGYVCSPRLSRCGFDDDETGKIPYLPDFWFPDLELYGEVKGSLTYPELLRLLDIAASLSSNDGGGCHDNGGHDLVVFGNIPDSSSFVLPVQLHMHKGTLEATRWPGNSTKHDRSSADIAGDYGGDLNEICQLGWAPYEIISLLTGDLMTGPGGLPADISAADHRVWTYAYAAARSARFEHGQSGA